MALYAFAATLIIWVLYAYKMGFGEQWIPICGTPGNVLGSGTQLSQVCYYRLVQLCIQLTAAYDAIVNSPSC